MSHPRVSSTYFTCSLNQLFMCFILRRFIFSCAVFPTIKSTFQFQEVQVNQSVAIFCLIVGFPPPTITWQHNQSNINSGDRVRVLTLRYGNNSNEDIFDAVMDEVRMLMELESLSVLWISNVVLMDMGHYACKVSNQLPQTAVIMRVFSVGYLVALGKYRQLIFFLNSLVLSLQVMFSFTLLIMEPV